MQEKPVALNRIAETRSALFAHEAAVARVIEAHGDDFGLKASVERLHRELATCRSSYLAAREWTEEEDFAALSGGENKGPPPEAEKPEA